MEMRMYFKIIAEAGMAENENGESIAVYLDMSHKDKNEKILVIDNLRPGDEEKIIEVHRQFVHKNLHKIGIDVPIDYVVPITREEYEEDGDSDDGESDGKNEVRMPRLPA